MTVETEIFGILNLTPDSFSDGGNISSPQLALDNVATMFEQGASYIDVGAESTRPNATPISDDEEWRRLEPVLPILLELYPGKISVDSYHTNTFRRIFDIGKVIINDVTAFHNPEMIEIAADNNAQCIISHIPKYFGVNIQEAHQSRGKLSITPAQVREELLSKASELANASVDKRGIILDPGIGFGKSLKIYRDLLGIAKLLPERNVMIGYSKKKFIGEDSNKPGPNLVLGAIAIDAGTKYLRLHQDLIPSHKRLISSYSA